MNIKKEYNDEKIKRINILKDFCYSLHLLTKNKTENNRIENKKKNIKAKFLKKMKEIAKIPDNIICLSYYLNHKNELMDDIKYHIYPKIFIELSRNSLSKETQDFYIQLQQYLTYLIIIHSDDSKQSNNSRESNDSKQLNNSKQSNKFNVSKHFDFKKIQENLKKSIENNNKNYLLFTPLTYGLYYLKNIRESGIKINESCYNDFLVNFNVNYALKIHENNDLSVNSIGFCIFNNDLEGLNYLFKFTGELYFDNILVYRPTKNRLNKNNNLSNFLEYKEGNKGVNGFIFAIYNYYTSKIEYLEHRKDKIKDYYLYKLFKSYDILEYVCQNLELKYTYEGRRGKSIFKFGTYKKKLNLLVNTINNTKVLKNIDYFKRIFSIIRKGNEKKRIEKYQKYENMKKLNKIVDLIFPNKKNKIGGKPNNMITETRTAISITCTIQTSLLLIITTGLIVTCIICMGKIMIEFPGQIYSGIRNFLITVVILSALTIEYIFLKLLECDIEYNYYITRKKTNQEKLQNKIKNSDIRKKAFYKNHLNIKYEKMKNNLYSKINNNQNNLIDNKLFIKEFSLFSNYKIKKSFERKHNDKFKKEIFKKIKNMFMNQNEKNLINKYKFIKTFSEFINKKNN